MNGYQLTKKLRDARGWYHLTSNDQALYHELASVCNDNNWKEVYQCSNSYLCKAINVSEKTLLKSRAALINAGLIYFKSGRSSRTENLYSFTTPFEKTKEISTESENKNTDVKPPVTTGITPVKPVTTPVKPVSTPVATTVTAPVKPVTTPVATTGITPDYINKLNIKTPPVPLTGASECERYVGDLKISFNEIKPGLLGDVSWKEQTAMHSGSSIKFLAILPAQIDIFLQYIVGTGEENSIQTLTDAKRRFFWWWKNHGKKDYEENSAKKKVHIW